MKINEIKRIIKEEYDLVSQFKLGNKYLVSLGLDKKEIESLQVLINLIDSDKHWKSKRYPNGANYQHIISDIDKVINVKNLFTQYNHVNPVKMANVLKDKI